MANWKYNIDISDIFNSTMSPRTKAQKVAERLKKLNIRGLGGIIERFKNAYTVEDFDSALDKLYDWGDCEIQPYGQWPPNKQAWINII